MWGFEFRTTNQIDALGSPYKACREGCAPSSPCWAIGSPAHVASSVNVFMSLDTDLDSLRLMGDYSDGDELAGEVR